MADIDAALEPGSGVVIQCVLREPDDTPVARLPDFLGQSGLAAPRLTDQKACPVPVETILDPRAIGNARKRRKAGDFCANVCHKLPAQPLQDLPVAPVVEMV